MAPKELALPPLSDFLVVLKNRLLSSGGTKAWGPIQAISEGHDSFLIDSIAKQNTFFSKVWPDGKDFDTPALVDEFVSLVTASHTFDPRLQKVFDKLVPKKTTELAFWRRYFAHVHMLLYRLSPLAEEMNFELVSRLPAAKPAADRRYAAKEPLRTSGDLSRADVMSTLKALATEMTSDSLIAALGDASAAAAAAGTYPNVDTAMMKLCLEWQVEYMESLGLERCFGSLALQPHMLNQRFDMQKADKEIFEALHAFMNHCNQAPKMAKQRLEQKPSDDPTARRFMPVAKLVEQPPMDDKKLLELVTAITAFVDADESRGRLGAAALAAIDEAGGPHEQSAVPMAQSRMMAQIACWQREYFESLGLDQDVTMRAVWSIAETFTPKLKPSADAPAESAAGARELLQAFGALRMAVQAQITHAILETTKPESKPEAERRFPAKAGALQRSGPLDRETVLAFTRKCTEVLLSEDSIDRLAAVAHSMSAVGNLSVTWQRELLESFGVDMDHGCRALGDVPTRFQDDQEVLHSFMGFQQACGTSAQKAVQLAKAREVVKQEQSDDSADDSDDSAQAAAEQLKAVELS